MKQEEKTTITISKETKQRLGQLGTTNETFHDIILKLMDCYEKYCKQQQ